MLLSFMPFRFRSSSDLRPKLSAIWETVSPLATTYMPSEPAVLLAGAAEDAEEAEGEEPCAALVTAGEPWEAEARLTRIFWPTLILSLVRLFKALRSADFMPYFSAMTETESPLFTTYSSVPAGGEET
jgi:hypothetical protein